jgi:hypothetical protein
MLLAPHPAVFGNFDWRGRNEVRPGPTFDQVHVIRVTITPIEGVRVVAKNLHPRRNHDARANAYELPSRNDQIVLYINHITDVDPTEPAIAQQTARANRSPPEADLFRRAGTPRHRTQHAVRGGRTGLKTLPNYSGFVQIGDIRQKHARERERMRTIAAQRPESLRQRFCPADAFRDLKFLRRNSRRRIEHGCVPGPSSRKLRRRPHTLGKARLAD